MEQWALVTGATSPVGRAVAVRLAKEGWNLLLHYHKEDNRINILQQECENQNVSVKILTCNFLEVTQLDQFVKNILGLNLPLTILVNNASLYHVGSLLGTQNQVQKDIMSMNFDVPCMLVRSLWKTLASNQGSIVNLGVAGLGKNRGNMYNSAYFCAKEALLVATRSFAKELAPHQVNVNMVSPGHLDLSDDLERFRNKLLMGRPGTVEEVAELVCFLTKPEAHYVTGQNIEVDGGAFL